MNQVSILMVVNLNLTSSKLCKNTTLFMWFTNVVAEMRTLSSFSTDRHLQMNVVVVVATAIVVADDYYSFCLFH
jgi:hypothetical protein